MQKKTAFCLVLLSNFVLWSPGHVLAERGMIDPLPCGN